MAARLPTLGGWAVMRPIHQTIMRTAIATPPFAMIVYSRARTRRFDGHRR
jgi:hypothetical protein